MFNFITIRTSAHETCCNGQNVEYGFKYKYSHVMCFLCDIHSLVYLYLKKLLIYTIMKIYQRLGVFLYTYFTLVPSRG